jgi:general stress protein YciG
MSDKKKTGFATMNPERVRELASKGGKAAHEMGVARTWNPDTAREAGRKGGAVGKQRRAERASTPPAPTNVAD